MGFTTRQIHAGVSPDPTTGSILTPIYQSTTFVQESVDKYLEKGYSYSRSGNPTVKALEAKLANLEGGIDCACFGTGMGATTATMLAFLEAGQHAIVSDEAITGGFGMLYLSRGAAPHDWLQLTGGAIGQGLPLATGAAVACPDRKVIALQADGSGLYTLQALWTQAREKLDVVTLLCANRAYRILQVELARAGVAEPGPAARALTDLSGPAIEWTAIAQGLGVPAARVDTTEDLRAQLDVAFREPGPRFIEVALWSV